MDPYARLRDAFFVGAPPGPTSKPVDLTAPEYAAWRFLHAWRETPRWTADHAVLLRQLARWQPGFIGRVPEGLARLLPRAGVELSAGSVRAAPFRPDWLHEDALLADGVDVPPTSRRPDEALPAEPYLKLLGYSAWLSAAQKEATWTALAAPHGSTTLLALPTGSGKSLCFQALARFGSGLTVVIVPTVALAMDQWRSAKQVLERIPDLNPRYFAADDTSLDGAAVTEEVRNGHCRLVFSSPEACVSGRLRAAIDEAARQGRLEHLIIDEAHIIETWGIYFRVDFQILSTRQQQWLHSSDGRLRTFLLSATFTADSRGVLQKLFGTTGQWREFISQRLRPEPVYFRQGFSGRGAEEARRRAVLDCAWHLPRPAILYTTEVQHAVDFAEVLREEGFQRVACFTGETPSSERRALLSAWRDDELDLMIATSAFGLGVDKSDVRAVFHACLPENLHRYYQEVGRGGRDGASSVCVLLTTDQDESTARGLAPRLLGEDLIQERWKALWDSREDLDADQHLYRLCLNAKRTGLLGTRTFKENVRWNKRLILQLLRAGKLELVDMEYVRGQEEAEEPSEWVTVRLHFIPTSRTVGRDLADVRGTELAAMQQGLDQMLRYTSTEKPLCRLLRDLYGRATQRVCGGCPGCRRKGRPSDRCPPLLVDPGPATGPEKAIVVGAPHPERNPREFRRLLGRITDRHRIQRFLVESNIHGLMLELCASAFGEHSPELYRVDSLSEFAQPRIAPEDTAIVVHSSRLSSLGICLDQGRHLVHLIVSGVSYLDENGRYPFEADGAFFHSTPEEWLQGG
jgi:ATP-dependent DNA helicase RecQ